MGIYTPHCHYPPYSHFIPAPLQDADGAMQEHRWAISGYVILIDGGAVSWCLKKQELVTLSTAKANGQALECSVK